MAILNNTCIPIVCVKNVCRMNSGGNAMFSFNIQYPYRSDIRDNVGFQGIYRSLKVGFTHFHEKWLHTCVKNNNKSA